MNMVVLFRLALIFIVMAGSVILAPSRGQMVGMTLIAICAEAGTETLMLDARGNPAPPHHPCPDCLPGLAAAPLPEAGHPLRQPVALPLSLPMPRGVDPAGTRAIRATARDPPLSA